MTCFLQSFLFYPWFFLSLLLFLIFEPVLKLEAEAQKQAANVDNTEFVRVFMYIEARNVVLYSL
jgi:hypothetical protein